MVAVDTDESGSEASNEVQEEGRLTKSRRTAHREADPCAFNLTFSETQTQPPHGEIDDHAANTAYQSQSARSATQKDSVNESSD